MSPLLLILILLLLFGGGGGYYALWSGWWTWNRRNRPPCLDRPAPHRTIVDSIAAQAVSSLDL